MMRTETCLAEICRKAVIGLIEPTDQQNSAHKKLRPATVRNGSNTLADCQIEPLEQRWSGLLLDGRKAGHPMNSFARSCTIIGFARR
jgi:hypothetical protein